MKLEQYFMPNYFHRELAKQKKLANEKGDLLENYYLLSNFYHKLLEMYLGDLLGIKTYDEMIEKVNMGFLKVDDSERDIYQQGSNYHYFYLRNTVYIEKLVVEDLNFFISKYNKQDYSLDKQTKSILERTYKEVITSDIENSKEVLVNYGPLSPSFFAPNNSIVFGIRCSDDFPCTDDEWLDMNFHQQRYLEQIKEELNEKLKDKLDVPIRFLVYDDESVLMKITESKNMI